MPRRRSSPKPKATTTGRRRRQPSRGRGVQTRPTLLIVHLDAERLRADGLHLGEAARFIGALTAVGLTAEVEILDVTDRASLLREFARFAEARRTFDVVVAIGHSNSDGIKLASDERLVSWDAFANYMKPFAPRRLMLIACQAGRWPAADQLFKKLPKLRRIFACPVNASLDLAQFMIGVVPYIVAVRAPRGKAVSWAQAAAIALTGRQVREWKRGTDMGNAEGLLLDLLAQAADPYARQIPALLRSFFR